jgi:subtilisin family serine protease
MSLAGKGTDDGNCGRTDKDPLHLAICNSVAAGVSYVAAAGNESRDYAGLVPASYAEVITVTAISDYDGTPGSTVAGGSCAPVGPVPDQAVSFSNFATLAEDRLHMVAAPGDCILSTDLTTGGFTGYTVFSGTSQASPHVAGAVALCIASRSCAGRTPAQILEKIVSDAAAYSMAHPDYGFEGDPLRPDPGRYYGFLVRAAAY